MDTAWLPWLAHELSRPFVEDARFNWPFRRPTFDQLEKYFEIEMIQGFLGVAKWPLPLWYLSPTRSLAGRLGRRAHAHMTCGPPIIGGAVCGGA